MSDTCERPKAEIVLVAEGREHRVGVIGATQGCDFALIDAILRLQLAAAALGWSIRLRNVEPDLRELVELVGCADRLGIC